MILQPDNQPPPGQNGLPALAFNSAAASLPERLAQLESDIKRNIGNSFSVTLREITRNAQEAPSDTAGGLRRLAERTSTFFYRERLLKACAGLWLKHRTEAGFSFEAQAFETLASDLERNGADDVFLPALLADHALQNPGYAPFIMEYLLDRFQAYADPRQRRNLLPQLYQIVHQNASLAGPFKTALCDILKTEQDTDVITDLSAYINCTQRFLSGPDKSIPDEELNL